MRRLYARYMAAGEVQVKARDAWIAAHPESKEDPFKKFPSPEWDPKIKEASEAIELLKKRGEYFNSEGVAQSNAIVAKRQAQIEQLQTLMHGVLKRDGVVQEKCGVPQGFEQHNFFDRTSFSATILRNPGFGLEHENNKNPITTFLAASPDCNSVRMSVRFLNDHVERAVPHDCSLGSEEPDYYGKGKDPVAECKNLNQFTIAKSKAVALNTPMPNAYLAEGKRIIVLRKQNEDGKRVDVMVFGQLKAGELIQLGDNRNGDLRAKMSLERVADGIKNGSAESRSLYRAYQHFLDHMNEGGRLGNPDDSQRLLPPPLLPPVAAPGL